ncbi:MAG: enoyl-CoA hydratase [Candidatus Azotimanducaceae bacterium]|jgi:enoyl-CoA hydratase/carnithine racemase
MTEVIVRHSEGVGQLILNRPAQRNSLTGPLVVQLKSGLDSLLSEPDCKVIIISGAEGYFCAGLDLKAFSADPEPLWKAEFSDRWADFHETVYEADLPIIGALQGFAIAGGSSLALACDFLVVGESAFMHVSEVERNMLAPLNVFWLTRRYPYQVALRMALLGRRLTGSELVDAGIAECCVADAEVLQTAQLMADRFAGFEVSNLKALKRSIKNSYAGDSFRGSLSAIKATTAL